VSHNPRILVIDDDPDLLEIVAYQCQASGYATLVAQGTEEGLATAAAEAPCCELAEESFIGKPFSVRELLFKIQALLGQARSR
jgi:DNA-binding response OmpR family regulator